MIGLTALIVFIKMYLHPQQQEAFDKICEFLGGEGKVFVLSGPAGTGKSTLMKFIVEYIRERGYACTGIAPTHKAKKVLREISGLQATTIASFLGKIRQHGYVGSKNFSGGEVVLDDTEKNILIVDELSMVCDDDFNRILRGVGRMKIIAIGDPYQIPSPSQPRRLINEEFIKPDNVTFLKRASGEYPGYELTQVIRYKDDIIRLATFLRENIENETLHIEYENVIGSSMVGGLFQRLWSKFPLSTKIITYTNAQVKNYNTLVRRTCGFEGRFHQGEVLMGYTNDGKISNGEDYMIEEVRVCDVGHSLVLSSQEPYKTFCIYVPDVGASENKRILKNLGVLAKKVNQRHSTKKDYARYIQEKKKYYFVENIFEYPVGLYVTETGFRREHPLLFVNLEDVLRDEDLRTQVDMEYPGLVEQRLEDTYKPIGDIENLATMFSVIEKDLDFGYACTAHKSQGSTLKNVFVDLSSFEVSSRAGGYQRTREKNQLRYVAVTRASKELWLIG